MTGPPDLPVMTNLFAWYDPSYAASLTASSGRVDQIDDLSGNGRHLTAATTQRPFTGSRTENGLNVLDFQGGQLLRRSATINFATGEYTVFVFCGSDSNQTYSGILTIHKDIDNDWNSPNAFLISTSSAVHKWGWIQNSTGVDHSSGAATPLGSYSVRKLTTGSGTRLRYPYASFTGLATNAASGTATVGGIILGTRWAASAPTTEYLDGPIGEVIVYSAALSDADQDTMYSYMTAKWGT